MHLRATISRVNGYTALFELNDNLPQRVSGKSIRDFAENFTRSKINDAFDMRGWLDDNIISLEENSSMGYELSTWHS